MTNEEEGEGKYRTGMMKETSHGEIINKTSKMQPCAKPKHRNPLEEHRNRKTTTCKNPTKKRGKYAHHEPDPLGRIIENDGRRGD